MHQEAIEEEDKDVIVECFDSYAYKIEELEQKDLKMLKQRKYKLEAMKRNILNDLEDAQEDKNSKLRDRERIHTDNNSFLQKREEDNNRMRANYYKQEIDDMK